MLENVRKYRDFKLITNRKEKKPFSIRTKLWYYKDIAEDFEKIFETSNFEIVIPLLKGKNEKLIGIMKDELVGKIMKELVALRIKTNTYLKKLNDENKKTKGTKKWCMWNACGIRFQDYKNCLNAAKIDGKLKYLEKKKFNVNKLN